jgi:hypothetical protein
MVAQIKTMDLEVDPWPTVIHGPHPSIYFGLSSSPAFFHILTPENSISSTNPVSIPALGIYLSPSASQDNNTLCQLQFQHYHSTTSQKMSSQDFSADSTSEASLGLTASASAADAAEASVLARNPPPNGVPVTAKDLLHRTFGRYTFTEWAAGESENISGRDAKVINGHVRLASPGPEDTVSSGDDEACDSESGDGEHSDAKHSHSEYGDDETGDIGAGNVGDIEAGDAEEADDDEASDDDIQIIKAAKVFPVDTHKCGDHPHAHSHAKQRLIRVPDGSQLFSVVLKIYFNDAQIDYTRTFASMSSITNNVDNGVGLNDHDFKHLYRLIEIRLVDLVAGIDTVERSMPTKDRRPVQRYTVELHLVTGEDSMRDVGWRTFLNYGTGLIAAEEAKDTIAKLEEAILDAIEVVDGLAVQRERARRDPQQCPCSVILDSEVRRAFEKEKQYEQKEQLYERRIATLNSNSRSLIAELNTARRAATSSAPASQTQHPPASNIRIRGSGSSTWGPF